MMRLVLVLAAVSLVFAQQPATQAPSGQANTEQAAGSGEKPLESVLVSNEEHLANSEKVKDAVFLQDALADDFIYVAYNGLVFTKDKIVENLKYIDIDDSQMENFKVRRLGPDAALLTYDLMVHGAIAGHQLPQRLYASSVWVQRGGHWLAVLHQETPAHHG